MIARLGIRLSQLAHRWVPHPFVLAIGLTFVVFVTAWVNRGDAHPMQVIHQWIDGPQKKAGNEGLWKLLAFAMQMSLILLTGYALAETRAVRNLVGRLAAIPKTSGSAAVLVALVAMGTALVNWGLGLIVGALLAREVGRIFNERGQPLHYPIICAAGYTGLAVWHGGLSGSAPLKVTSEAQLTKFLGKDLAAQIDPMLMGDTIGSTMNMIVIALCAVIIPLTLYLLTPKSETEMSSAPLDTDPDNAESQTLKATPTPASRMNESLLVAAFPALIGLIWFGHWVHTVGLGKLNPNVINLVMLCVGLLLYGSAQAYAQAIGRAIHSCAGIILQYPFYAGIMGIMAASGMVSGLGEWMAGLGPKGLAVSTFYSGGLVNLFVPSGGGQWAVQGPVVMQAALDAGADPSTILMALSYGDQWTNLIQPFWALPLLGICRIEVSAIIGYTAILLVVTQICFLLPLLLFS